MLFKFESETRALLLSSLLKMHFLQKKFNIVRAGLSNALLTIVHFIGFGDFGEVSAQVGQGNLAEVSG